MATPTQVRKLNKFNKILDTLASVDTEFPIQWASVFAHIALDEGCSLKDVSERTDISMSVMSRTIGALSNYRRMGKPYGLVLVKSAKDDKRRKELYLSAKGKKLVGKLMDVL